MEYWEALQWYPPRVGVNRIVSRKDPKGFPKPLGSALRLLFR